MTRYTSKEIKNRLSNIGEAIGVIALEYIEKVENENKQLKQQIEKLQEEKQYETCPYRSTDMGCDYCDYRDRNLKYEVEENDK